jgi:hypothetical protein
LATVKIQVATRGVQASLVVSLRHWNPRLNTRFRHLYLLTAPG